MLRRSFHVRARADPHTPRLKQNHATAARAATKAGDVPNNLDAEWSMESRLTGRNGSPSSYRNAIISSTAAWKQVIVKSSRRFPVRRFSARGSFDPCRKWRCPVRFFSASYLELIKKKGSVKLQGNTDTIYRSILPERKVPTSGIPVDDALSTTGVFLISSQMSNDALLGTR